MLFDHLPDTLPDDPLPLFAQWFAHAQAQRVQNNPDAMALATVDADGRPSARMVLCKQLHLDPGYLVFFTNYESRKAQALSAHPYAAAIFHWDSLECQVRVEGPIVRSPAAESDAYFASRPRTSQLGAWASAQSRPLASRAQLLAQVAQVAAKFPLEAVLGTVPRPAFWGGYRLWIEHLELWVSGPGRVHDRARWSRSLTAHEVGGAESDQAPEQASAARDAVSPTFTPGAWRATRLNP